MRHHPGAHGSVTTPTQGSKFTSYFVHRLGSAYDFFADGGLPSAALLDKVRALDLLPRLGALRTLDLRGNDIRVSLRYNFPFSSFTESEPTCISQTGVTYISQVLKRNRTLKVLNLADNKIAVDGLVAIAEALKYNSSLETLDMSRNPCCGPGLEGVSTIVYSFPVTN